MPCGVMLCWAVHDGSCTGRGGWREATTAPVEKAYLDIRAS